jgi:hypothetical protein
MPPLHRAATMQTVQRSEGKPGHQHRAGSSRMPTAGWGLQAVRRRPGDGGSRLEEFLERKTFAVPVVPVPGVA